MAAFFKPRKRTFLPSSTQIRGNGTATQARIRPSHFLSLDQLALKSSFWMPADARGDGYNRRQSQLYMAARASASSRSIVYEKLSNLLTLSSYTINKLALANANKRYKKAFRGFTFSNFKSLRRR